MFEIKVPSDIDKARSTLIKVTPVGIYVSCKDILLNFSRTHYLSKVFSDCLENDTHVAFLQFSTEIAMLNDTGIDFNKNTFKKRLIESLKKFKPDLHDAIHPKLHKNDGRVLIFRPVNTAWIVIDKKYGGIRIDKPRKQ